MSKVEVNAKGIKNRLKSIKPYRAISEYIWNGFDAGANTIEIDYLATETGDIYELSISDNGKGMPYNQVHNKFKPVLSSEKRDSEVQHTLIHGKNGLGRLTFYHFAQTALWRTCYKKGDDLFAYTISADESNIDQYEASAEKQCEINKAGTIVSFNNIFDLSDYYFKNTLIEFLKKEFAWFLELRKDQGFSIIINGIPLSVDDLIKDEEVITIDIDNHSFTVKYIQWKSKLNRHFSRYYCVSNESQFKYSKPTTLNNKGDEFYHSVFIESHFFDQFKCENNDGQTDLFNGNNDKSPEFKDLIREVNAFLREKRKPFIIDYAKSLVEEYETKGIFPKYNARNRWEQMRAEDIKEMVSQLYQVDPRIFSNLNTIQKKTLVSFMSLIVDGGEIDDLFKILENIVELTSSEREKFAKQLQTTKLSSIINTIELISDRYKSVAEFKKLVFDPQMYAGEVPHLQRMMEKNYWLIGEEYQLLTAAEPKFEEALRRFTYILNNDGEKRSIDHKDKNREMDLFLIRQGKKQNIIENIVLELKHPTNIRLGKKEFDQIYDYYQVIKSEPQFNASNMEWKFYLIGNKFDSTDYIIDQLKSHKSHGEPGLAFTGKYKIYVFTWSEVFTEFELKHDFLNEKLKLELERLSDDQFDSADDIVAKARTSDAPEEFVINE
jgi:hypothetical protein